MIGSELTRQEHIHRSSNYLLVTVPEDMLRTLVETNDIMILINLNYGNSSYDDDFGKQRMILREFVELDLQGLFFRFFFCPGRPSLCRSQLATDYSQLVDQLLLGFAGIRIYGVLRPRHSPP